MNKFFLLFFSVLWSFQLYGQDFSLSGNVLNINLKPLKDVQISITNLGGHQHTDSTGFFNFTSLKPGQYVLNFSYAGYQSLSLVLQVPQKDVLHINMLPFKHQLKEVIIKENRVQKRLETESMNIEIISSDYIQKNLGGSLMQTLDKLPGIHTIGIGSGQSKPLIRGLGFNRVVVVDKGIKHEGQQWGADHGLEIDQFAAAEVELIKGAASLIYGSDAIGGVINVKPPGIPGKDSFGGSIDLIGKTNNKLYGTSVNLFGRRNHFFYDTRLTYQNYGDYSVPADTVFIYDYAVKLKHRQLRNTAGRESGLHLHTGYLKGRFKTIFYLSNIFSRSGFFANAHGLEPRKVDTLLHDRSFRDIQLPSQQVDHFKVVNQTSYFSGSHKFQLDLGYQRNFRQEFSPYVNHGYMPPAYPDTMTVAPDLEREFKKQVYSFHLRDEFLKGRHLLSTGINLEYQQNSINGWTFLVPAFRQTTFGVYLYDQYKINEKLLFHAGLRYDYGRLRLFDYKDWFPSGVYGENNSAGEKLIRSYELIRHFNSLVWSVGLNYNAKQFMIKANVGKSFRMPIAKELGANGVNYHYFSYEKGDSNLSAEQAYQADLSLGWNARTWSVLISPFYNYFPNYIYLNPTARHDYYYGAGNQIFQYAQSSVMRYGGEFKLKMNLWRKVSTELVGEYLFSRQMSGDKKGFSLPFSPPASAMINLTWEPDLSGSFKDTYFSADYRITANQYNIVPPEKNTPGYKVIDLQVGTRIHLSKQTILLSFQVQNLLNQKYLNHTSFYRLIELPEAGRNLIISFKIPFLIHNGATSH